MRYISELSVFPFGCDCREQIMFDGPNANELKVYRT